MYNVTAGAGQHVRGVAERIVMRCPLASTLRLVYEGGAVSVGGTPVRGPRDVVELLRPVFRHETAEVFFMLMLDCHHKVMGDPVLITRGVLDSCQVHPREVFRPAILAGAAAIVVAHNHPTGDPSPSAPDRSVTTMLVAAGRLLDIPVHDHIIIGDTTPGGRYLSFAEAGLL